MSERHSLGKRISEFFPIEPLETRANDDIGCFEKSRNLGQSKMQLTFIYRIKFFESRLTLIKDYNLTEVSSRLLKVLLHGNIKRRSNVRGIFLCKTTYAGLMVKHSYIVSTFFLNESQFLQRLYI